MGERRNIRCCALQALYQFDSGLSDQPDVVRNSLEDSPGDEKTHQDGFNLAMETWKIYAEADKAVAQFSKEWSTHRQPVVDRCILRLAYYEIILGETPPKVVINEAVELAKEYSTEKSHLFINGILDKLYR